MKKSKTNRGFNIVEFKDTYGEECSLQKSSLATEDRIWLGISNVNPKIMASDAIKLGLPNIKENSGWVGFEIPEEVLINSRMHLDKKQAKKLIKHLTKFVETGEI
jgi:hypothetical protein